MAHHSILLVVSKPKTDNYEDEEKWKGCLRNVRTLTTQNKDIEMLAENVLLLPLDLDLNAVSQIHSLLLGLPYRYIIFDEEIQWHEVSKKGG